MILMKMVITLMIIYVHMDVLLMSEDFKLKYSETHHDEVKPLVSRDFLKSNDSEQFGAMGRQLAPFTIGFPLIYTGIEWLC